VSGRRRPWQLVTIVAVLAAAPVCSAAPTALVVILSSRHEPYRLAAEAAVAAAGGVPAAEYSLSDWLAASDRPPGAVIALGDGACHAVVRAVPPESPVVLCPYAEAFDDGVPATWSVIPLLEPVERHVATIGRWFPGVRRLVILHHAPLSAPATIGGVTLECSRLDDWVGLSRQLRLSLATADGLFLPPDPFLMTDIGIRAILETALRRGKPVFTFSPRLVRAGALAAVVRAPAAVGRAAVDTLLGRPQAPITAELVVNGRVAAFLNIAEPKPKGVDALPCTILQ